MTRSLAGLLLDPPPDGAAEELVWFDDRVTSRADVARDALLVAEALAGAGVQPGSVVASLVPTSPAAVAAMFGVWSAGCALLPLNPRLTEAEIGAALDEVGPAAVLRAGGPVDVEPRAGRRSVDGDVALVLFTSGTTAAPKPVLLRHSGTLDALEAVLRSIRRPKVDGAVRPPMPNLIPFSLSLWSGIYNVCFALTVGAPVVLMDRFTPAGFAALVKRHGIRSSVLAPAMISMLVDAPDVDDLAPLRFVRNATAPLPVRQAERFHARFGVPVLNGYGQTELGGEVVGWNADDIRRFATTKLGAVGRPHPGIDVRILDDDGSAVAPGEPGEICVRSPYQMAGYLGRDDEARFTDDGLLRTGDLGMLDDDGFLWITGRRSDVVNRSGLKVFPAEVEDVIRRHDEVRDVAVAGVPDDRVGEVPWAFVVGERDLAAELEELCRGSLAPYKVPARFVRVPELPRNDVGKVLRRVLVAQATGAHA